MHGFSSGRLFDGIFRSDFACFNLLHLFCWVGSAFVSVIDLNMTNILMTEPCVLWLFAVLLGLYGL